MSSNWRTSKHVLVPEAHAFGMIGVVRSLGRAGYRVHAVSPVSDALGLHSRYAYRAVRQPEYDSPGFRPWLEEYLSANSIDHIVPSEAFLVATAPIRDQLARYYPHVEDVETLYMCMSKAEYLRLFATSTDERLRQGLPATRVLGRGDPVDDGDFAGWRFPVFVKADGVHAVVAGEHGGVWRADSPSQVVDSVRALQARYRLVLAQEFVSGCKATVNFLLHRSEVIAESMCVADHENPHTGGLTAYRHTWWHDEMREDALVRMRALRWNGPVMVEYRWDQATRTFSFLEINARYWAALNMDLLAGTDFPRIQLDHANGRLDRASVRPNKPLRCRITFPADFGYVLSSLRAAELGLGEKLRRCLEFLLLGLDPRVKNDLWYPGDRGLYWRQLWYFVRSF